jgi:hypothetical protein
VVLIMEWIAQIQVIHLLGKYLIIFFCLKMEFYYGDNDLVIIVKIIVVLLSMSPSVVYCAVYLLHVYWTSVCQLLLECCYCHVA